MRKTLRMSEVIWQRQRELSPILLCVGNEREVGDKERTRNGDKKSQKGRGNEGKKRVKCGQRGNKQGSKRCQSWPTMGEIDRKAKWMNTKKDQKSKEGEKRRDEGRTEEQNWTKMGLTGYQKQGWGVGGKWRGRDRREGGQRLRNNKMV